MTCPAVHPLRVALLAVPEATASALFGMMDVLASVGRDWEVLNNLMPRPAMLPRLVSATGAGFRGPNGAWIQPDAAFAAEAVPDIVCVPELFLSPEDSLNGRYDTETEWLRACFSAGALVCSVCSGALLLAEAGLLDSCEATTHWGFCAALARRYPRVRVRPGRVLVASGPGQRIITAGGAASWNDLLLYLVARHLGPEAAPRVAKVNLLQWHGDGQLPFASLARTAQHADRAIAACQEWLADNYREANPVAAVVLRRGLPERSFKRRFRAATGLAPIEYVQNLRLEEAKQVLETTDLPVEDVASAVGYSDGTFFRRLFRRRVGLSPAAYRRRFQPIARPGLAAQMRTAP